jgi:hypothetical protein
MTDTPQEEATPGKRGDVHIEEICAAIDVIQRIKKQMFRELSEAECASQTDEDAVFQELEDHREKANDAIKFLQGQIDWVQGL